MTAAIANVLMNDLPDIRIPPHSLAGRRAGDGFARGAYLINSNFEICLNTEPKKIPRQRW
jgi:hypothetical protein